ncbi:hypothetical protein C7C56_018480 [Massilia glaciei]|uniref:Uncharacterized protein n=2 Tax=Massilia glaciei TaxID=1524097 RepID=A0A2U2HH47_9BURK|nr:hypothetical protein C7C56_018480 [Massilia glaciei]
MNRHSDALDAVCELAGVRKLNEFKDFTDLEFNMDDFDDEDDEDDEEGDGESEAAADPETGLGYGIDDMAWFDAAEGLVSMKAMRGHVATEGLAGLDAGQNADLLDELDDCIAVLDGPASRAGKFHLAVIG